MGEASKVDSLTLLAMVVLQKDGITRGKEVKRESNTSSRLVKGASLTTSDARGRGDSQSS